MAKIALLHHDIEWTETKLIEAFSAESIDINCHDIRTTNIKDFVGSELVINRIYASVANRDYPSVQRALTLMEALESEGVRCVNNALCSKVDYNKYFAYQVQKAAGVAVPECRLIDSAKLDESATIIMAFAETHGFPVVVKPNTGGRGKDVHRLDHPDAVPQIADSIQKAPTSSGYEGDWIVQAFVPSVVDFDIRIAVAGDEVLPAHTRKLISTNGGSPWMGSRTLGSKCEVYPLSQKESTIALEASKAIQADYNVVDVVLGKDGPVVIENNPTPNFDKTIQVEGPDRFVSKMLETAKYALNSQGN